MKKQIIVAIAKLTLSTLFVISLTPAHAQTSVANSTEKTTNVKYIGNAEGMLLFNVAYDNPSGSKFSVTVYDKTGNPLFQEVYFDKKFEKKFKLPTQASNKLTFIIRNSKDMYLTQSFEVNTHLVEDVVVTKG